MFLERRAVAEKHQRCRWWAMGLGHIESAINQGNIFPDQGLQIGNCRHLQCLAIFAGIIVGQGHSGLGGRLEAGERLVQLTDFIANPLLAGLRRGRLQTLADQGQEVPIDVGIDDRHTVGDIDGTGNFADVAAGDRFDLVLDLVEENKLNPTHNGQNKRNAHKAQRQFLYQFHRRFPQPHGAKVRSC